MNHEAAREIKYARQAEQRRNAIDPFFPVQLRTSHWKAIVEAIESTPNNSAELTEAYIRLTAYLQRKDELDDCA